MSGNVNGCQCHCKLSEYIKCCSSWGRQFPFVLPHTSDYMYIMLHCGALFLHSHPYCMSQRKSMKRRAFYSCAEQNHWMLHCRGRLIQPIVLLQRSIQSHPLPLPSPSPVSPSDPQIIMFQVSVQLSFEN